MQHTYVRSITRDDLCSTRGRHTVAVLLERTVNLILSRRECGSVHIHEASTSRTLFNPRMRRMHNERSSADSKSQTTHCGLRNHLCTSDCAHALQSSTSYSLSISAVRSTVAARQCRLRAHVENRKVP